MLLSSSVRACVNSGDEAEEASDRIRRYEEKSDLVCFRVARTSLPGNSLAVVYLKTFEKCLRLSFQERIALTLICHRMLSKRIWFYMRRQLMHAVFGEMEGAWDSLRVQYLRRTTKPDPVRKPSQNADFFSPSCAVNRVI